MRKQAQMGGLWAAQHRQDMTETKIEFQTIHPHLHSQGDWKDNTDTLAFLTNIMLWSKHMWIKGKQLESTSRSAIWDSACTSCPPILWRITHPSARVSACVLGIDELLGTGVTQLVLKGPSLSSQITQELPSSSTYSLFLIIELNWNWILSFDLTTQQDFFNVLTINI